MLGAGFLEKLYERSLLRELALASGLAVALLINLQRPKLKWKRALLGRGTLLTNGI